MKELADGRPVILYGVDLQLSEVALCALRTLGIEPVACTDGRTPLVGSQWHGLPIQAPEAVPMRFNQPHVVICPSLEFWTVHDRLWNMGLENLVSAADVIAAVGVDRLELKKSASTVRAAMQVQERHQASRQGGVFLPMVNLILTERCTLNCRYCSTLTPYITTKRDYAVADMVNWIERLSAAVDDVISFHLIGGEVFLHQDVGAVIEAAAGMDNFRRVSIVTNATLLPTPAALAAMRATPKAHVFISNYGALSRKLVALKTLLKENGIPVDEQPQDDWRDMGGLERRGRDRDANRIVFRDCIGKNCGTLLAGKLHRCTRSAFASRTGHVMEFPDDSIDLTTDGQSAAVREKIRSLFFQQDYLAVCDYCDGARIDTPKIRAAEQVCR